MDDQVSMLDKLVPTWPTVLPLQTQRLCSRRPYRWSGEMSETGTSVPTKSDIFNSFLEMLNKPYAVVHIDEATRDGTGASASFGYEGTASIAAEITKLKSQLEEARATICKLCREGGKS